MTSPARKISSVPAPQPAQVSDQTAIDLFYWMSLTRAVEERALNLYRQGKLPGSYYTGRGQEAIAIGIALPLRKGEQGDWLSPWIRDLGSYLVHGVPPWRPTSSPRQKTRGSASISSWSAALIASR